MKLYDTRGYQCSCFLKKTTWLWHIKKSFFRLSDDCPLKTSNAKLLLQMLTCLMEMTRQFLLCSSETPWLHITFNISQDKICCLPFDLSHFIPLVWTQFYKCFIFDLYYLLNQQHTYQVYMQTLSKIILCLFYMTQIVKPPVVKLYLFDLSLVLKVC